MDNFSKLMADMLGKGQSLDEVARAVAAAAAKEAVESFARAELSAHLGYERGGKRAEGSKDSRNGSYERTVQTSFGPISVSVPRDRDGDFRTAALPRYKRRTEVVSSAILKLYSSGMTDEEMRLVIESLYDSPVSKSYVSSVTDAVMADVEAFGKRELPTRMFCLCLDSTYLPLRRESVQREAVNIAMGIDADGNAMVAGYSITPAESAEAYRDLLADFKGRGLSEVAVVVSDGLAGIDGAIAASFPKAKRQRCFVHLMRNLCSKVRPSDRKAAADAFMSLARKSDRDGPEKAFSEFKAEWGAKYRSVAKWAESLSDFLTFYDFPEALRRKVYTNNPIEGFNKQIKRKVKEWREIVEFMGKEGQLLEGRNLAYTRFRKLSKSFW